MNKESITKNQSRKLAKLAGSRNGKLKKKHINRLKKEAREGRMDTESLRSFNMRELMELGLYEL